MLLCQYCWTVKVRTKIFSYSCICLLFAPFFRKDASIDPTKLLQDYEKSLNDLKEKLAGLEEKKKPSQGKERGKCYENCAIVLML